MSRLLLTVSFIAMVSAHPDFVSGQQWKTDVGFYRLLGKIGPGLERAAGVAGMIVESYDLEDDYMCNVNNPQFSAKFFVFGSGPCGISGHAHSVSAKYFGKSGSIAKDLGNTPEFPITGFADEDWLNNQMGFASGGDPVPQPYNVSNHSYIGNLNGTFTLEMAEDLLRRVDYSINQTEMTTVVGTNNGSSNTLPAILVHGYNSITVGVTDGSHASSANGPTYLYGNGRIKPEIVAPSNYTSGATPMVSSAAGLLHEAGAGTDAVRTESLKAILLAGATKNECLGWSRSTTSPLDLRFGAGELNIYNSYHIMKGGEFDGTTIDPNAPVGDNGWDYEPVIEAGTDRFYEFEVENGMVLAELSLVLTWNMEITDLNASARVFDPVETLADMNLEFYNSSAGFLDTLIDSSVSTVDNVEHIYFKNLMPGTYHLRVTSDQTHDFGLAWRSLPVQQVVGQETKFLDGVVNAGQLPDTFDSDDSYLELDPSPTANPYKQQIEMILLSETNVAAPGEFGLNVEAAMTGGPEGEVIQVMELWNETTRQWEELDSRPATNGDSIVNAFATGDLTRFIHPITGEIIAKLTWSTTDFAGSPFFWSIDLDQVVWQIAD